MKNAKLIIDGKEIEVKLSEEDIQKLTTKRKTGYEIVEDGSYYFINSAGSVQFSDGDDTDIFGPDMLHKTANYYSHFDVAANNARVDELVRQLRRFAVENRRIDIDWTNIQQLKYYIYYHHTDAKLQVESVYFCQDFHQIYFDTKEMAELAIEIFKDELLWYFTEYRDSL